MFKRLAFMCAVLLSFAMPAFAQSESLIETMDRLRKSYGTFNRTTAGEFLNAVAWEHRAEGVVLLGKNSGNDCDQPKTAALVSCDFLVNKNTKHGADVIIAWDVAGTPTFGGWGVDLTEQLKSGARTLVEPVDPGRNTSPPIPVPTPSPVPTPASDAVSRAEYEKLVAALDAMTAKLGALEAQAADADARTRELANSVNDARSLVIPTGCKAQINLSGLRIPLACSLTK